MKKNMNIFRIVAALMALVLTASCIKVDIIRPTVEEGQVSLTIKCSDIAQTRATEAGEDAYNENKIDRLDVFFYAAGASDDAAAIYRMTLTSLNATGSYTYDQRIETTIIETIFGTGANAGTQAKIYAIANLPAGITVSDNASVNELKATAIETAALAGTVMQDNFVMDSKGDDVVTYNSATRGITGEIKLYRAASKIALFITEVNSVPVTDADGNVQKDAKGNDIMWTANTNGMMVRLNNGVKKTHLDNIVSPYNVDQEADYFSFASGKERKMVADGSQWKQELPFYSYSSDWSADGKDKEAYLTLIVPWQKSDAPGVYHNTYYQVPINGISEDLVRNNYYKISLKVSRLGTFTEGDAVTITPGTYIILDWTTNTIDADMLDYRYLVVDQKEYTIYNQEELYIPFASSHDTEIVSVTCTQEDLSTVGADPKAVTGYTLTRNDVTKLIHFQNDLENDMSKDGFDFTPITLTFTIQHKDNTNYKEVIKVIQYPAIYAEAKMNSDYASGGANDGVTGIGGELGFVWVNGYNTSSDQTDYSYFGSVHGIYDYSQSTGAKITNPNMYVMTITSVQGTDYVVGDPRVYENATSFIEDYDWCPAPYFTDNSVSSSQNHTLTYYYPTDYASRTYNMVAPKFRVASAYSVTYAEQVTDINTAKGRCASYQEDGYPAGRWRMPTKAEYEFIVYQSYKGRIPVLYDTSQNYWCAHGYGKPNAQGKVDMNGNVNATTGNLTLNGGASIRCVYDEWYWEDYLQGKDKIPFTWGDMPR